MLPNHCVLEKLSICLVSRAQQSSSRRLFKEGQMECDFNRSLLKIISNIKLNIFIYSHSTIFSSWLSLRYQTWSRQLSDDLHIIAISMYLHSKLCCKTSDKLSSLEHLLWTIREIRCFQIDSFVLMSDFVLTSHWSSKLANAVLVSKVFSCLRSVSHINWVVDISQGHFQFNLTEYSMSPNTCEMLSL